MLVVICVSALSSSNIASIVAICHNSYSYNENSLRSNDSDDEYDDEASASGQEDAYGANAVLAWAEVCYVLPCFQRLFLGNSFIFQEFTI